MTTKPKNPFGKPADKEKAEDSFDVDMTNVETSFRIKAGDYAAKLLSITKSNSKAGNPMFVWKFVIIAGEYQGREFTTWTALTDVAMWKVAEVLVAFGLPGAGSTVNFKAADVQGKRVIIRIKDDTDQNDNETSSIQKVIAHPDGTDIPKGDGPGGKKPGKAA